MDYINMNINKCSRYFAIYGQIWRCAIKFKQDKNQFFINYASKVKVTDKNRSNPSQN